MGPLDSRNFLRTVPEKGTGGRKRPDPNRNTNRKELKMSWGYRLRIPEGARANGIDRVLPYENRVVTAGKLIPFLERVKGRPSWGTARYGLNLYSGHSGKLFWNAKKESLRTNETWSRLMRMRIAIPVDAYVESSPTRCWTWPFLHRNLPSSKRWEPS